MPIESGHYIITNVKQRNIAFLLNSDDGAPLVGTDERGDLGEQWSVKARSNGHYSISNLDHKKYAIAKPRAALGETVEARDEDQQWLIQESRTRGQFMIATIDNGRVWGLEDNWQHTPITLFDPRSDIRCRWTFRRVGSDDDPDPTTVARNLAKEETVKREIVEAELKKVKEDRTRAESLAAEEMRRRLETEGELKTAKEDLLAVANLADQETKIRETAEGELKKTKDQLAEAKRLAEQEKREREKAEVDLKTANDALIAAQDREVKEKRKRPTAEKDLEGARGEQVQSSTRAAGKAANKRGVGEPSEESKETGKKKVRFRVS